MKLSFTIVVLAVITASGCATNSSTMPESKYNSFSSFWASMQACFKNEYIDPQMYGEAKGAFLYVLEAWKFDQEKMTNMMNEAYSNARPSSSMCRTTEGEAYHIISSVRERRASRKNTQITTSSTSSAPSNNWPVFCNTIGTTTMCN